MMDGFGKKTEVEQKKLHEKWTGSKQNQNTASQIGRFFSFNQQAITGQLSHLSRIQSGME